MNIWGKSTPSVRAHPHPIFSNWHLGNQVPIYPSAHFVLVPIRKKWAQLRYPFLPKVIFFPKLQVPIFPSAHLQKFWVNGHREFGVPF